MPEPTLNAPSAPGWFGKLPNIGDFATRRLPDGVVHDWDSWLQDGMAYARAEFGSQWQSVYLVAPILRFWIAPGTLDAQGWAGLVMPSVDRVGRYYPLMFARPVGSLAAALAARAWFAALELTARRVLDIGFTPDDLEFELGALPPLDADTAAAADVNAQALADRLSAGSSARAPLSVWWVGDAHPKTTFMRFDGLPHAAEFTSMLGVRM